MIQIYNADNTDFEKNGNCVLFPASCETDITLNQTWEMTLVHDTDDEVRYKYIQENAVIKAPSFNGYQLFRIYKKELTETEVTAYARPIFFDSADECFLVDIRPTDKNGQQALDILMNGTKFNGISNIQSVNTAYYVRKNLIEALNSDDDQSFVNRWGGEFVFDNYTVYANDQAGTDKGVTILYGRDIQGINETINTEDIVTRIVPMAYNGYTLEGNTPWVDSENINKYPKIYTRVVQFDDVKLTSDAQEDEEGFDTLDELRQELIRRSKLMFTDDKVDTPTVTLEIDMYLLQNVQEYKDFKDLVSVSIGDTVHCKHRKLGIISDARVIAMVYDNVQDTIKSVTLGDYEKNYFNDLTSVYQKASNVFNNDGTVNADWLNGTINALNVKFKALRDIAQKQDVRAILFEDLDEESPTFGAMCLGTMGFEISNKRNETNTDWEWRTFGTGSGFTCDALIVGKIMGSLFELDLDAGTVKFGERDSSGNISNPTLDFGPNGLKIRFENNYVTDDELSQAIDESSASLKQEFNTTINGALIGTNNIIPGTSFFNTDGLSWVSTDGVSAGSFRIDETTVSVSGKAATFTVTKAGEGYIVFDTNRTKLQQGKTYTWSMLVMYTGVMQQFQIGLQTTSNGLKTVDYSSGYLKVEHTFVPSSNDMFPSKFVIIPLNGVTEQKFITIADIKLQEGDTATGWTPAAEDLTSALDEYSTTDEMNSSIERRAQLLTREFNETLGGYPTKIEMNSSIETNAAGLTANFNAKLEGYSDTMEMNAAIQASASGIMSVVSQKVNTSDVSTIIEQNATAVRIAWNNYTQYVQFEQSRLNIYETGSGDVLLFSLGSSGMRFYKHNDSQFVGQIGTNQLKDYPDYKGLDFDLSENGTYMTWAVKKSSSATTYTIALAYSNKDLTNLPKGLSAGDSLDMRYFQLKNASLVNASLDGMSIVKSHGGVVSMGFVYYTNGTPQNYGYVEVSTTDRGMVGINAWQSDGRLKKNIQPSEKSATNVINHINVREFDWKSDGSHENFGLIAQELEKVDENYIFKVPQKDKDGNLIDEIYQIRPEKLIPLLIKAVQELSDKVDNTKQIALLKNEIIQQYNDDVKFNIEKQDVINQTAMPILSKRDESGNIEFINNEE